ncbi:ABC transporter permease [Devosia rhizoryzae]|uniref:ABC transporter permease n=1 Tax=Devosia rhizoryzae TaxID=2774137 RepID=A0ABX7C6P3_9HYPH|nr:ABC transporter permease [Devosia rhizoryzae]QQR38305.1 ABC transporter permease [Devosia rhizoryzae]
MLVHALKRVLLWIPSVLLVLLAVYALAFYGAGDPIKLIFLREPGGIAFDPNRLAAIREAAGLDRPFFLQFADYVWNVLQGNFGNSLTSGRSVGRTIAAAAPVSISLGILAIVLTTVVAIPLGVIAALRQNTALDYTILGSALFLYAVPSYVAGPILMVLLILVLPGGAVPYGWGGLFDVRVILPLLVLSFHPIALIVRQTRSAVIEVLTEDFVRTARAKGLKPRRIVMRHILRPILTPVLTQLGLIMITLVNGAVFVELVFGLPGLGRLAIQSLLNSDYPVILAVTLIASALVMVSNLVIDLAYPLLDPRAAEKR